MVDSPAMPAPRKAHGRARKPGGVDAATAARELLGLVMIVMRSVAADMRRSPGALAPAQMGMLMKVSVAPCTMSALARHQSVSLPTISKSVDMLVRRGWLERWVDKYDRRHTMVRLTDDGRRVLGDIKKRTERYVRRSLAGLTAGEREQLVTVTRMLSRVLPTPGQDDF
jgi:DNA-binding MarR family transcriptional regulator